MKHVHRLLKEPDRLAHYRLAHPEEDAALADQANTTWERFRNNAPDAYDEIRTHLVAAQLALCGYCEQRLTDNTGKLLSFDQQIEHVDAKSTGDNRTLDYRNFMLCCGGGTYREKDSKYFLPSRHYSGDNNVSCGQTKGSADLPAGCDPRQFPRLPRLVHIDLNGTISADDTACRQHGIDPEQLNRAMNEVLNLNCERLKRARRKVLTEVTQEYNFLAEELLKRMNLGQVQRNAFEDLLVSARLAPDKNGHLRAFWTTERQYLEPWSSTWISNNQPLLGG